MLDQTIRVGDRVACAFRAGNTSELRVGTVKGFGRAKDQCSATGFQDTLIVDWDGPGYVPQKPTGIWISRRQFVRLGA